jgi:hypothetical protein
VVEVRLARGEVGADIVNQGREEAAKVVAHHAGPYAHADLHESLGLEGPECLPDRPTAHLELLGELGLGRKQLALAVLAGEDPALQRLADHRVQPVDADGPQLCHGLLPPRRAAGEGLLGAPCAAITSVGAAWGTVNPLGGATRVPGKA